jgi:hypothetical protein
LEKFISILTPIDAGIVKFQNDRVPISDVIAIFTKLELKFKALQASKGLTIEEWKLIRQAVTERKEFIICFVHTLTFFLDPKYHGVGLSRDQRKQAEDYVCDVKDADEKEALYLELNAFLDACLNMGNTNYQLSAYSCVVDEFRKAQIKKRNKTALLFWSTDGNEWPRLKKIALPLFYLVASSATSERSFSAMAFVHSKNRNRLKANKLMFIRSNFVLTDNVKLEHDSDEDDTSEIDSDASI